MIKIMTMKILMMMLTFPSPHTPIPGLLLCGSGDIIIIIIIVVILIIKIIMIIITIITIMIIIIMMSVEVATREEE